MTERCPDCGSYSDPCGCRSGDRDEEYLALLEKTLALLQENHDRLAAIVDEVAFQRCADSTPPRDEIMLVLRKGVGAFLAVTAPVKHLGQWVVPSVGGKTAVFARGNDDYYLPLSKLHFLKGAPES